MEKDEEGDLYVPLAAADRVPYTRSGSVVIEVPVNEVIHSMIVSFSVPIHVAKHTAILLLSCVVCCRVMSCRVVSCRISSRLVLPCLALPCLVYATQKIRCILSAEGFV